MVSFAGFPQSRGLRWLLVCAVLGLFLHPSILRAQTPEYRGFWVDAFGSGFKSAGEVTAMLDNVRAANGNMLLPEVRKRGDAYYLGSPYEPKATDMAAGFDSLQDMINKAHDTSGGRARIDVHAWIVSYKIWGSQSTAPAVSTPPHPYNAHPDWLTQDYNGATWDGTSYSFDPGIPKSRNTLTMCAWTSLAATTSTGLISIIYDTRAMTGVITR